MTHPSSATLFSRASQSTFVKPFCESTCYTGKSGSYSVLIVVLKSMKKMVRIQIMDQDLR